MVLRVGCLTAISVSLSQLLEEMSRCHRDVAVSSVSVCVYQYCSEVILCLEN